MPLTTAPFPTTLPATPSLPFTPGSTSAYTVMIGGARVNVIAGTLFVENQIGQRSTGSLGVWTNPGVSYLYGTQVLVYDEAGNIVYAGYTTKDKITKPFSPQGTGYLEHSIQLMDNCYRADKRRVFKTYLNTTAGNIVRDLLGSYLTAEGVTATTTSIASGPTITEIIWNGTKSVADALTYLATQAGYWWNIDANGVLFFQPYGAITAPFILDGTQVDSAQDISVEFGNDLFVNKQFAKGAYSEVKGQADSFHGNSLTRSFTCRYELSSKVSLQLNGVDQTLGTKGNTGGSQWYWAVGDAVIAQDPTGTPIGPGDTLVVYYNGRFPVLASAQNPALIAAQKAREGGVGTGLVESIYTNTKVHTLAAAFQIASNLLSHYGQDTTVLTFATRTKGLQPGQLLTVNLPDFGLNRKQMLISGVSISDQVDGYNAWFMVQAVGSPVESAQWQTFWQGLMNQSSDPSDFQDTDDTSLALLFASSVVLNWTGTVHATKTVCLICGNSTLCGNSSLVC